MNREPLRRLKKTLQDNLSLSSKLFLRGLIATSSKTVARIVTAPRVLAGRVREIVFGRPGISEPRISPADDVLEGEHLAENPKQIAEPGDPKQDWPRIIVFDERVPSPDRDAGSLRMFLILKTLAKWSHVIFVPFNRPQSLDY
ncbi:MAG TPA: hypothetical protein VF955_06330, partial [Pyrinomonadaceae bacterium]